MENIGEEVFYGELIEFDPKMNNISTTDYRNPSNNITMDEDGIYSLGLGAAPLMGFEESNPHSPAYHNPGAVDPLGELPPDLLETVNSLLLDDDKMFDPSCVDQIPNIHVDVAAMYPDNEMNDDIFGNGSNMATIDPSQIYGAENPLSLSASNIPTSTRRQRKPRKAKADAASVEDLVNSPFMNYDPQYPTLEELGVPSPSSSSSYHSDASSVSEDVFQKARQRRPRVSYSTLTDEERYLRIRDLNNEASRHYREKQRKSVAKLEEQLPALIARNKDLNKKANGLEDLVARMKNYSHTFLGQHMPQHGASNF